MKLLFIEKSGEPEMRSPLHEPFPQALKKEMVPRLYPPKIRSKRLVSLIKHGSKKIPTKNEILYSPTVMMEYSIWLKLD
ncbi:MAG: hypothetical protein V3R82_05840 [Candidatus Hydrothermarchaeales archaeon]